MKRGFFHSLESILLLLLLSSVLFYWPHQNESNFLYDSFLLATCEDALIAMNAASDFSPQTVLFLHESVWPNHAVELQLNEEIIYSSSSAKTTPVVVCQSNVYWESTFVTAQLTIRGLQTRRNTN